MRTHRRGVAVRAGQGIALARRVQTADSLDTALVEIASCEAGAAIPDGPEVLPGGVVAMPGNRRFSSQRVNVDAFDQFAGQVVGSTDFLM